MPDTTLSSGHLSCLGIITPPGAEPFGCISSVEHAEQLPYYGPYQALIRERLQGFSSQIAKGLNRPSNIPFEDFLLTVNETILSFLQVAYTDCLIQTPDNASACWFNVAMTNADSSYLIPRWHQDGRMFCIDTNSPSVRSKYATTLLGPATLLLDLPHTAEMMEYLNWKDNATSLADSNDWTRSQLMGTDESELPFRKKVADFFSKKGFKPVPVRQGQVVRFSWGHDFSPVHSEPDFSEIDRVFISVLFGSEPEIKSMAKWRQTTYED